MRDILLIDAEREAANARYRELRKEVRANEELIERLRIEHDTHPARRFSAVCRYDPDRYVIIETRENSGDTRDFEVAIVGGGGSSAEKRAGLITRALTADALAREEIETHE